MDADFGQALEQVLAQAGRGPTIQLEAEAQAGDQGAVDAHFEPRQEILIAHEDEGEGALSVGAGAGQQAQFFERGGVEVLGFFEHEHRPERGPLLPEAGQGEHVVAATVLRGLPGQADQLTEQVAAHQ